MRVPTYLWSKTVKELDGNQCVYCHTTEKLEAHHIRPKRKYPDLENELENGITLCRKCHDTAHCGNYAVDMPSGIVNIFNIERYSTHPDIMERFIEDFSANTEIIYCDMTKKEAREFKAACKAYGTTPNAVFKAAADQFMEGHRSKADE